jgi:hypothetical protein
VVVQVAYDGVTTIHQGGLYILAGGLEVDVDGITSNSGLTVNVGGAYIAGSSQVLNVMPLSRLVRCSRRAKM